MTHVLSTASRMFVGLLLVVALGACRTYGGYGSEEGLMEQIEAANEQFADALNRARNDLERLSRATAENAALQPALDAYEEVVRLHGVLLAEHRERAEHVKVRTGVFGRLSTSYRDLNRCLGSILSEQDYVRIRYDEAVLSLAEAQGGLGSHPSIAGERDESLYQAVPPQYARMSSLSTPITLDNVLRSTSR